jgi:putative ABC transport system ATP-binding protein
MSDEHDRWREPRERGQSDDDPFAPELKPASEDDARWRPTKRREAPNPATEATPAEAEAEVENNEGEELRWRPPERRARPQTEPPPPAPADTAPDAKSANGERWRPAPTDERLVESSRAVNQGTVERAAHWVDRMRQSVPVLDPIVSTESLTRDYPVGETIVHALKATSLQVGRGQLIAVHGRSGSGKTTMLNLIGGLDRPSAGKVWIDGVEVTSLPESELVGLRRYKIGFIFQTFGLIPILSAAENVEVPLRLANVEVSDRDERVRVLLELVGLGERAKHRPHELSGGEQQRVAIARALANSPRLLIADEPTGQLDSGTGRTIMTLIRALVKSEGVTAIVATHDPMLIDLADRIIELRDGEIIDDSDMPH